jgi:hypothetical protein
MYLELMHFIIEGSEAFLRGVTAEPYTAGRRHHYSSIQWHLLGASIPRLLRSRPLYGYDSVLCLCRHIRFEKRLRHTAIEVSHFLLPRNDPAGLYI